MKNKLIILVVLGIMAAGCSRKAVPAISNECDSTIQALIHKIEVQKQSYKPEQPKLAPMRVISDTVCVTDDCSFYQVEALQIAAKYNTAIKERDYYKELAEKRGPRKVVNNINVNSKNKDTQIGDANVKQEAKKGPAQNGDGNEAVFKPNKSATGEGSSVDNSKKGSIWPWILVGMMSWFIIQNFIWNAAKKYIPGFLPVSFLTKIIGKIKFLT